MKSIKNKLFFSYLLILFIALSVLSFLTISVFKENKERKSLQNLETNTKKVIENIKKSKKQNFDTIDKNIDLKSNILLIFENNKLVFTNTSTYKTQRIFYELEEEDDYESDEDEILSNLLPKNISTQIFKAMLENSASEQGSRMSAMDNATRNAGEMVDKLTIEYNRSRQAAITKELIEIISGAESL